MEKPLFYQGQPVICVSSGKVGYNANNQVIVKNPKVLIEGKRYHVSDPEASHEDGDVFITVCGIDIIFSQMLFVPEDFDKAADEAIRESLNESLRVKA